MRSLITAVVALTISAPWGAHAQPPQGTPHRTPPARAIAPAPPTVPPPIVYPFPPLMTPPAGGLTPRGPDNPAYRPDAPRRRYGSSGYSPFILGPGYVDTVAPNAQAPAGIPARVSGWLRLDVTPVTAQVFVDGSYVGTVDDVNAKRELQLTAGTHRIEFRASLHQTLVVDVQIAANDTVTYRGTLDILRPAAPPAPPVSRGGAGGPEKMYVIPNCYMGNVPPRASRLPAGCDIKQVQVLGPK